MNSEKGYTDFYKAVMPLRLKILLLSFTPLNAIFRRLSKDKDANDFVVPQYAAWYVNGGWVLSREFVSRFCLEQCPHFFNYLFNVVCCCRWRFKCDKSKSSVYTYRVHEKFAAEFYLNISGKTASKHEKRILAVILCYFTIYDDGVRTAWEEIFCQCKTIKSLFKEKDDLNLEAFISRLMHCSPLKKAMLAVSNKNKLLSTQQLSSERGYSSEEIAPLIDNNATQEFSDTQSNDNTAQVIDGPNSQVSLQTPNSLL